MKGRINTFHRLFPMQSFLLFLLPLSLDGVDIYLISLDCFRVQRSRPPDVPPPFESFFSPAPGQGGGGGLPARGGGVTRAALEGGSSREEGGGGKSMTGLLGVASSRPGGEGDFCIEFQFLVWGSSNRDGERGGERQAPREARS